MRADAFVSNRREQTVGDASGLERLAQTVMEGLAAGESVEIQHLGVFYPDAARGFRFEARSAPRVFVAYVTEDAGPASRLYDAISAAGFQPWMDVHNLTPGQNWPRGHRVRDRVLRLFCAVLLHAVGQ